MGYSVGPWASSTRSIVERGGCPLHRQTLRQQLEHLSLPHAQLLAGVAKGLQLFDVFQGTL